MCVLIVFNKFVLVSKIIIQNNAKRRSEVLYHIVFLDILVGNIEMTWSHILRVTVSSFLPVHPVQLIQDKV